MTPGQPHSPDAPAAAAEAVAGERAEARRDFGSALNHFRRASALDPGNWSYHHRAAAAAERAGRAALVESHLLEAIRLDPHQAAPHYLLGTWYFRNNDSDRAVEHLSAALTREPGKKDYAIGLATALMDGGDVTGAWGVLEPLVTDADAAGVTAVDRWVAHLYQRVAPSIGQEEQALAFVNRVAEVADLPDGPTGRAMLHFSAATLLDRLRRYDEAFGQARRGNELVRAACGPYDPASFSRRVSAQVDYFTRRRLAALPRATNGGGRPVFIVGMPRSGTSLVEEILGSHPQVYAAGELQALRLVARDLISTKEAGGQRYPDALGTVAPEEVERAAAQYLSAIDALAPGAARVVDKHPLNFRFLELVEALFPGARVVHCVRDPLDTCLSCYMTGFGKANPFTSDLGHLAAYYRDYRRLMGHWKSVLTVPILDVRYEDVVGDVEGQARRLLSFLDLPWDERCLRFHENRRAVRTASRDQVRRPLYASSVGRWRHYQKHLGPLMDALRPAS